MQNELTCLRDLPGGDFDLGAWIGRRQAFSTIAGTTSAADAECLRHIRNTRLYRRKTSNWHEFCVRYIGSSKAHVDRQIQYLEDFGPAYFALKHLTHIPPEAYRAIAPHVTGDGLAMGNETIPLTPDNAQQLAAAVTELRRRVERRAIAAPRRDPFAALEKQCHALIARMEDFRRPLEPKQKDTLAVLLERLRESAAELGVDVPR